MSNPAVRVLMPWGSAKLHPIEPPVNSELLPIEAAVEA